MYTIVTEPQSTIDHLSTLTDKLRSQGIYCFRAKARSGKILGWVIVRYYPSKDFNIVMKMTDEEFHRFKMDDKSVKAYLNGQTEIIRIDNISV